MDGRFNTRHIFNGLRTWIALSILSIVSRGFLDEISLKKRDRFTETGEILRLESSIAFPFVSSLNSSSDCKTVFPFPGCFIASDCLH